MDAVARDLFVGTTSDASDGPLLREHGITAVVSLTHRGPNGDLPEEVTLVSVPMVDGPQNSRRKFETAVGEVRARLDAGDTILVHCSAGASRSPTVAATALALEEDRELRWAFEQIRDRRPEADPHEALIRQAGAVYWQRSSVTDPQHP